MPGRDQDAGKMGIESYRIAKVTKRIVAVQVAFENPVYISQSKSSDKIQISIRDENVFIAQSGQRLNILDVSKRKLPLQLKSSGGFDFTASAKKL